MKIEKLLSYFLFFFVVLKGFSQADVHRCHANEKMDEQKKSDPLVAQEMEESARALAEWTAYYIEHEYDPNNRTAIYTIPVVYHIVHTNGPENVSDADVYESLARLNEDYNKLNASWTTVNPAFLGIVADVQVEFKLAKKTNTGVCTNGITRTYSPYSYTGDDDDWVGAVEAQHGIWPGNKYLNIFVCGSVGSGIAGYTNYPSGTGTGFNGMKRGIHMRYDYLTSTTISHEAGHWLNLAHLWGSANEPGLASNCSTDDDVSDTPNTLGWQACNVNGISCGDLDNVENYMEYSGCRKMFTDGQKARMHAALNSTVGGRNNLWSPANLAATGVSLPDVLCQVVFTSDKKEICVGETVNFQDLSFNTVTGHAWSFTGGNPSSSAIANPAIVYDTPGVYAVSLQATDGTTTITNTATNYIVVLANPGDALPYKEGFETLTSFPDNARFTNYNADSGPPWAITTTASSSGDKSLKLNNYSASQMGTKDAFMSRPIDLSGISSTDSMIFNFRYAYRKNNSTDDEWLRFFISKDCGETWVLRKNLHGTSLSSVTAAGPYTPLTSSEWYDVSITNINSDYFVSNFRYKFEFENDGGNNIYIDDINLYPFSMVGMSDLSNDIEFTSYPNPTNDILTLNFSTSNYFVYTITIKNVLGQIITTQAPATSSIGQNIIDFEVASFLPGVYFLNFESEGKVQTIKFVKQ